MEILQEAIQSGGEHQRDTHVSRPVRLQRVGGPREHQECGGREDEEATGVRPTGAQRVPAAEDTRGAGPGEDQRVRRYREDVRYRAHAQGAQQEETDQHQTGRRKRPRPDADEQCADGQLPTPQRVDTVRASS